jgi:hypothetical protein
VYGEERTKIDILATAGIHYPATPEVLSVVECKRREPAYHKWLFFSRMGDLLTKQELAPMAPVVWCKPERVGKDGIIYGYGLVVQPETFDGTDDTATQYDCFLELKKGGNDRQRTNTVETSGAFKTSATEIEDAFRQVAVGMRGVMRDMYIDKASGTGKSSKEVSSRTAILPVVVSSAPIYSCSFEDAKVDLKRGILDVDSTELVRQRWLLCSYSMPYELRFSDRTIESDRLCVWVVGAEDCLEFFRLLKDDASQWREGK